MYLYKFYLIFFGALKGIYVPTINFSTKYFVVTDVPLQIKEMYSKQWLGKKMAKMSK